MTTQPGYAELRGLTDDELHAMDLTAELMNTLTRIVGQGRTRDQDLNEICGHIHVIQHVILAQAAGRCHPDRFRLLDRNCRATTTEVAAGHCWPLPGRSTARLRWCGPVRREDRERARPASEQADAADSHRRGSGDQPSCLIDTLLAEVRTAAVSGAIEHPRPSARRGATRAGRTRLRNREPAAMAV